MGLVPGEADGLGPWREGGGAQESPPGGGYKWEGPKEMGPWGVVLSCGSQGVGLGGLVPG